MVNHLKNEKKKGPYKILIVVLIFLISFAISFGAELISYKSHQEASVDNGLDTTEMAYTEFIQALESGNVEKANLSLSSPSFVFYLKSDETPYVTSNPGTQDFKEKLLLNGVNVNDKTYLENEKNNSSPYAMLLSVASSLFSSALLTIMVLLL